VTDLPDIVYVVKPGDDNDELRYSLRSVVNLPHRQLFVVGYTPAWVRGAISIDVQQQATKWLSSTRNMLAACSDPRVGEDFVYFNDDMFVMHPIDRMPIYHRGKVDDVIREHHILVSRGKPVDTRYLNGMERTAKLLERLLRDRESLLSYELHVPLPVRKSEMLKALAACKQLAVAHKRTVYGNLAAIGGQQIRDVKISKVKPRWDPSWTFLSTDDEEWQRHEPDTVVVADFVRGIFSSPGPYEARP